MKKSATAKAIQQQFFEDNNIQSKTVVNKKSKHQAPEFPDALLFLTDGNVLEHEGNGVYRYIKSETKYGKTVQFIFEDLEKLKSEKLVLYDRKRNS